MMDEAGKYKNQIDKLKKENRILKANQEKFVLLNEMFSEMLPLQDLESIYKYIAKSLQRYFTNTIVLYVSINEQRHEAYLEIVEGVENKLMNKILSISGFNPIGKKYKVLPKHNDYFRSGKLVEFKGSLADFSETEFPKFIAHEVEKLIGLNKIYIIGISKDKKLLAAIHLFTFAKAEINDNFFIETFVSQAGTILQKKMAEEENKKLTVAIEQSPVSVVITDLQGNIDYVNPAFEKQTGYPKEEAVGINTRILKSSKTKPEVYTKLWKTITAGEIWEGEFINKTKNNNEYIEKTTIAPIFNSQKKKTHYIGIKEDVTEKVKIEKQIKASEEKYRLITENASDVIWIWNNAKQKLTYISPSVLHTHGYTPDEALQQDLNSYLVLEFAQQAKDGIFSIVKEFVKNPEEISKNSYPFEAKGLRKDGSQFWIEMKASFSYNKNGEVEILGITRDIDKRKQYQEHIADRLRYEENLAQFSTTLFLNEPNVINKSLQYLLIAAKCSRVYLFENFTDEQNKLSMKETFEVCAHNVTPAIDNPELQHIIYSEAGLGKWENQLSENKIISGIITDFPEQVRAIFEPQGIKSILIIPIFVYQKWFGFIGFDDTYNFRDWNSKDVDLLRTASEILGLHIENQKNKQTIEKRNTELNEAIATKDKFFNIIAHDLKNPFNSILGLSDLIIANIEKYDKDKIKRFVGAINESGKNTFRLLENLLDWSGSQQDKIPFQPQKIKLYNLIYETYMLVSHTASEKQITINLDIPQKISFEADGEMMKTIIRNLVSNAIKFTPENGRINISGKKSRNNIILEISDTGIGMNEQIKKTLFKIDETKSQEGTNGERGTGFGLLLCKEFVDKHKGTIQVKSELNKGSRFVITLPSKQNENLIMSK